MVSFMSRKESIRAHIIYFLTNKQRQKGTTKQHQQNVNIMLQPQTRNGVDE